MTEVEHLRYTTACEGYFMSEQDKDAQVGRLMREHKQNHEELARLQIEAAKIGKKLSEIGEGLTNHPEGVHFNNEGIDTRFTQHCGFLPADLDSEAIRNLCNDYRKRMIAQGTLASQIKHLGYSVPSY